MHKRTLRRMTLPLVGLISLVGCEGVIQEEVNGENVTLEEFSGEMSGSLGEVLPYQACQAGDPEAKLLAEVVPPSTVSVGQTYPVSITFANCGQGTWRAIPLDASNGHKLGAQAPQDSSTWGFHRRPLPGDVAYNQQVELTFNVTAPQTPGQYGYQWAIVYEGVRWLNQKSARLTITVQEELPTTSGVSAYEGCRVGDPEAKFIDESAPPATMSPGQAADVSVTFANCGKTTWRAVPANAGNGYKLGAQAPRDNLNWGAGRYPLPGDVAPNQQVRIDFQVTAPQSPGQYGYQWAILEELVRWLHEQKTPLHTVTVEAPAQLATLCPGVQADTSGLEPASAAIQMCLDATPEGGTLELPAGVYLMTGPVVIARRLTLRTQGSTGFAIACLQPGAPACAVLRAAPDLNVENGFFQIIDPASSVTIEHVVLDGNRMSRIGSSAASTCANGYNRRGFNAIARGHGHTFRYNASINALCGTGMEWLGHGATIVGNTFASNGQHSARNMWADGLTIHQANDSIISDNMFVDNSDIDLILGSGSNSVVQRNRFEHVANATFAALMLDNFNGGTPGDFRGTVVSENDIECGNLQCDFGIMLGPHAWYLSANIFGGEVWGNTIRNAKLGLNIDGAGTATYPIAVFGNAISGSPSSAIFHCGVRNTSNFNISPDSVVDRRGETSPVTTYAWHICP